MKNIARKISIILSLLLLFSIPLQGMSVYAASSKKANLSVSKDGQTFKVKKKKKSYTFRYDWDPQTATYTGYDSAKAAKVVSPRSLVIGLMRDGQTGDCNNSILVGTGITLNKKIYSGMPLSSFHKKKSAWGSGYYAYWDTNKNESVVIGKKKPSNSYVKKRCKSTGLYWVGARGCLSINISIIWNSKTKRAETSWIEIYGSAHGA